MKMRRDSKRNLNLRTAPLERSHCSFRLIRSPLFRLRRTAHCADVRLAHPRPFQGLRIGTLSFRIAKIRSTRKGHFGFLCRSGGIRTRGLLVPNQTRYQTALHLDAGADEGTRTPDLLITNRLLYQLSHIGTISNGYYIKGTSVCPALFFMVWTSARGCGKLLRHYGGRRSSA